MSLRVYPLDLKSANALVSQLHRHHKKVQGHRFSLGVNSRGKPCGAIICGRPVARALDPARYLEVTRLVTDGTKNACSVLYAAAARAAQAMGFEFIQTYTLLSEPGTSLRAAGWTCDGQVRRDGVGWQSRTGRKGPEDQPQEPKQRWRKKLNDWKEAS